MKTNLSNGSTTVEQSDKFDPRKLRVTCHAVDRACGFRASYHAPKPISDASPSEAFNSSYTDLSAYVSVSVTVHELPHETPASERLTPASAELQGFLSVEQARALHKALGEALECSEVK